MSKKLTVILPCYGQLTLARRSLEFLKKQTFNDFEIVILDDHSPENYRILVNEFPELQIQYIRNENNLGAIKNIYKSISYPVSSKYKMSLHEDDILHPEYFEKAIKVLDTEDDVRFLGSEGIWFKDEININLTQIREDYSKLDRQKLGQYFLKFNRLIFGSIIYRNDLPNVNFDLDKYAVLCDRPFLLDIMGSSSAIIMKSRFIFVRDHGANDNRGSSIEPRHLFNLYENYRKFFDKNKQLLRTFLKISTNDLLLSFPLFPHLSLFDLIKEGSRLGLIRIKYINIKGIYGIIKFYI